MIYKREYATKETVMRVAQAMVTAAVTAPKGHGIDNLLAVIVDGEDKAVLANHMRDIYKETGADFFNRDAGCVDASECVVLLATKDDPILLDNCGYCGLKDCAENRAAGASCAFNVTDLGIAVGSAVSIAADNRVDARVFFSAGKAALRMGIFDDDVRVCYGIPLSATSKSIFFDRDPGAVLL